jgi:uncharacterized protein YkwD
MEHALASRASFRAAVGILICAVLTVASSILIAPGAAAATAGGETINRANQQQIIEVFNGINTFRATKGLKPVTFNATLSEMSEDWSDTMASSGEFYHNPSYHLDGRVKDRVAAAGEIIAARSDTWGQGLVNQWIASPPHNAIMSDPNYATIGVGIARIENARPGALSLYGTVNFFKFWTPPAGTYTTAQDFFDGKPSLDPAPLITVNTESPVFDDALNKVTLPAVEGVEYFVNGVLTPPGTHSAPSGNMRVSAAAKSGYRAFGLMLWNHSFAAPAIEVVPKTPTFDVGAGTYTVPFTEGVIYFVDGSIRGPSTYTGGWNTTVSVRAEASSGYKLRGTTEWEFSFGAPATPTDPSTPPAPAFADVRSDSQFAAEIGWLAAKGISTGWKEGTGTTTYRPLAPVNRDAMAAFMYRLAGQPAFAAPATSPFRDLRTSTQFFHEITWLAARRISTGWDEGNGNLTYRPLTPVNRDAMAAFLYRLAGEPDFTPPPRSPFRDVSATTKFYKEITWLAAQKISSGWIEGDAISTYRPLQPVNRDAMAAFMYRWNAKFGSL